MIQAQRWQKAAMAAALILLLPAASMWRKRKFRSRLPGTRTQIESTQQFTVGTPNKPGKAKTPHQVAASIAWLQRHSPITLNCLSLALAASWLLSVLSQPSEILVGVRFDSSGQFQSHAWLLSRGRVISGGPPDRAFSIIWRLGVNQ